MALNRARPDTRHANDRCSDAGTSDNSNYLDVPMPQALQSAFAPGAHGATSSSTHHRVGRITATN
jgi:hypothetical protein